jgi:hypothetical protein
LLTNPAVLPVVVMQTIAAASVLNAAFTAAIAIACVASNGNGSCKIHERMKKYDFAILQPWVILSRVTLSTIDFFRLWQAQQFSNFVVVMQTVLLENFQVEVRNYCSSKPTPIPAKMPKLYL